MPAMAIAIIRPCTPSSPARQTLPRDHRPRRLTRGARRADGRAHGRPAPLRRGRRAGPRDGLVRLRRRGRAAVRERTRPELPAEVGRRRTPHLQDLQRRRTPRRARHGGPRRAARPSGRSRAAGCGALPDRRRPRSIRRHRARPGARHRAHGAHVGIHAGARLDRRHRPRPRGAVGLRRDARASGPGVARLLPPRRRPRAAVERRALPGAAADDGLDRGPRPPGARAAASSTGSRNACCRDGPACEPRSCTATSRSTTPCSTTTGASRASSTSATCRTPRCSPTPSRRSTRCCRCAPATSCSAPPRPCSTATGRSPPSSPTSAPCSATRSRRVWPSP